MRFHPPPTLHGQRGENIALTEIEIKLSCADQARLLAAFRDDLLQGAAVSAPKTLHMHSEYYDTPDAALFAAGCSLRFRTENGSGYITLKTDPPSANAACERGGTGRSGEGDPDGAALSLSETRNTAPRPDGLAVRSEYEFPATSFSDGLPRILAAAPQYAAALRAVLPQLRQTASVTYERVDLTARFGETVAAFSLDQGYLNGDAENRFFELEAELKRGDVETLHAVCRTLSKTYGLVPVTVSKLRRALDARRSQ